MKPLLLAVRSACASGNAPLPASSSAGNAAERAGSDARQSAGPNPQQPQASLRSAERRVTAAPIEG